jgi:hypothetical protein
MLWMLARLVKAGRATVAGNGPARNRQTSLRRGRRFERCWPPIGGRNAPARAASDAELSPERSLSSASRTSWDVLGRLGTSWDVLALSTLCVQSELDVEGHWGSWHCVRPGASYPGPRCRNASDGTSVKRGPSGLGEADPERATLTGATAMRPSWRVREGSPPCQRRRAPGGRRRDHAHASEA